MIKRLLARLFGPKVIIGTFEGIELTFGNMGHQLTTIDGQVYYTWWDYKTWPKAGDKVEVRVTRHSELYRGDLVSYKQAHLVRIIE